jgi:hypothetical protein
MKRRSDQQRAAMAVRRPGGTVTSVGSSMGEGVICAVGDVHGHMQLALGVAARWQQELDVEFDAVLLAGDVAAYADESRLDQATRRHAQMNPCEVELLRHWIDPPAPWLDGIFAAVSDGGLGLICPIVMVAGNHEDFDHLESIKPASRSPRPVRVTDLPRVDPAGRISYLPNGWRCETARGIVIAGLGGLERNQRHYEDERVYFGLAEVRAIERGAATGRSADPHWSAGHAGRQERRADTGWALWRGAGLVSRPLHPPRSVPGAPRDDDRAAARRAVRPPASAPQ